MEEQGKRYRSPVRNWVMLRKMVGAVKTGRALGETGKKIRDE